MKILVGAGKFIGRTVNDMVAKQRLKNVQTKTYKQTGKQLEKAKRQGKYVNAKLLYKSNLQNNKTKIQQSHSNIDKFIDEV